MNAIPEYLPRSNSKYTHSVSLKKLQSTEKSSFPILPNPESKKISRTPIPTLTKHTSFSSYYSPPPDPRRQNFYEILGVSPSQEKNSCSPRIKAEVQFPKISLTDFMGSNKDALFKKFGFIEYYHEYKKNNELQKIIDQKQTLSMANIAHIDKVREYAIRNSGSPRHIEIDSLFEKPKYTKQQQEKRLDKIQTIIEKCDDLYKEGKKFKKFGKEDVIDEAKKRQDVRRLTWHEKFLIKKHIDSI